MTDFVNRSIDMWCHVVALVTVCAEKMLREGVVVAMRERTVTVRDIQGMVHELDTQDVVVMARSLDVLD